MLTSNERLTSGQILFPIFLIGLVIFISLINQTTGIIRERHNLNDAVTQQAQAVEQAQKVDAQVNALAAGTAKLADKGDNSAKDVVARMKKAGIVLGPQPQAPTTSKPASTSVPVSEPASTPAQ
jgi:hypothetical protein